MRSTSASASTPKLNSPEESEASFSGIPSRKTSTWLELVPRTNTLLLPPAPPDWLTRMPERRTAPAPDWCSRAPPSSGGRSRHAGRDVQHRRRHARRCDDHVGRQRHGDGVGFLRHRGGGDAANNARARRRMRILRRAGARRLPAPIAGRRPPVDFSHCTGAPRPLRARSLDAGRSPGLRVVARSRLLAPNGTMACGTRLAAYSCGGSRGSAGDAPALRVPVSALAGHLRLDPE